MDSTNNKQIEVGTRVFCPWNGKTGTICSIYRHESGQTVYVMETKGIFADFGPTWAQTDKSNVGIDSVELV